MISSSSQKGFLAELHTPPLSALNRSSHTATHTFTAPTMPANTVETALTKLLGIKCVPT